MASTVWPLTFWLADPDEEGVVGELPPPHAAVQRRRTTGLSRRMRFRTAIDATAKNRRKLAISGAAAVTDLQPG
jgi:hypothetical protein